MEFHPHSYQAYAEQAILDKPAVALWLEMGLGKTAITLSAIVELHFNRLQVGKVLIVAPKRVAEATWQAEARKWDHTQGLRFVEILGTAKQRRAALYKAADIWIINRENIPWLVDEVGQSWPFDMVVLDEASSFKNHQAKRFKKLRAVRPRIRRIVELTGTPRPRDYMDLWAQLFLLDQGQRLGKTISAYRDAWFKPGRRSATTIFEYDPVAGAEQEINRRVSDICLSMKASDYLELPDMVEDDIPVKLDAKAQADYDRLERDLLLPVGDQVIDAATAAVLRGKLLQLSGGAAYDDTGSAVPVNDCKLDAFAELIEALDGQGALIFYWFQHELGRLQAVLDKLGTKYRVYRGPDDAEAWNSGSLDVLLAHPASCAYGLNLQAGGHHIVWYTLTDSLELYQQGNARLHRQGQRQPVVVHRLLVQGSVDEDVAEGLADKDHAQARLLAATRARIEKWRK